jgi:serine/threonine-protein kinase
MKRCVNCNREFKDGVSFCPYDGFALGPAEERDPLVGRTLDYKFRLDEKIAEGGMGRVYKATHVHLKQTVAVKVLHAHLASDEVAVERFRREARASAQINHPNAIAVTDFGVMQEEGIAYLVMEFLEGVELRDRIKKSTRIDLEETYYIVLQTCAGLEAAHAKGIIHRDLKPDNIWLISSQEQIPQIKVIDFGIAKLKASAETSKLTRQGMLVGTPYYMSPEQCQEEELDPRSDIYSLGVIVYEMLTGRVPFEASNPIGVVLKHIHEAPEPIRKRQPDVPDVVERVVLRALSKERAGRQETAAQFAQEFDAAYQEAGIELKLLSVRTPYSFFSQSATPTEISRPPEAHHAPFDHASIPPQPGEMPEMGNLPDRLEVEPVLPQASIAEESQMFRPVFAPVESRDASRMAGNKSDRSEKALLIITAAAFAIAILTIIAILFW